MLQVFRWQAYHRVNMLVAAARSYMLLAQPKATYLGSAWWGVAGLSSSSTLWFLVRGGSLDMSMSLRLQ